MRDIQRCFITIVSETENGVLDFVAKYAANVHSQNGEDGIVSEIFNRLQITFGNCVEVGGNDGHWLSNSRNLIEHGWSGVFVETEWSLYLQCKYNWQHRRDVECICSRVDGHNINAFVTHKCTFFSTDTDGPDYEIFNGLKARPEVVIIEIDSSIPPDSDSFNADGGAGYRPMTQLAMEKDYFLVAHTGNLVLVKTQHRSLFPEIIGNGIENAGLYFNRGWLK